MRKKIAFSIAGILVILGGLVAGLYAMRKQQTLNQQAAPATSLSLTTQNSTVQSGTNFDVNIEIQTNENLVIGSEIYLTFDSSVIRANSISPGSFFGSGVQVQTSDIGDGTISYVLFIPPSDDPVGPNASGTVATINFTGLSSGSTTINFAQSTLVAAVGGDVGVNVLETANPLTINVTSGGELTSTPTQTPTPTTVATATPTTTSTPTPTGVGGGASATATPTTTSTPTPTSTPSPTVTSAQTSTVTTTPTTTTSASSSTLQLTNIDNGDVLTDSTPTFRGVAKANTLVTITVNSDHEITGTVTSDASGNWSWTVPEVLEDGAHVATITSSGETVSVNFTVNTSGEELPDAGFALPTLIGILAGFLLLLIGIVLAF